MKRITFEALPNTVRNNIVVFSPTYHRMIEELKTMLANSDKITLHLGRISDTGVSIKPPVEFFDAKLEFDENQKEILKIFYFGDHYAHDETKKIPIQKSIRLDNPFGEIPILPGYEQMPKFFLIGSELKLYTLFIDEVRSEVSKQIGNEVQLGYKNDDNTFSVIEGTVKEVNKGNIFMKDYHEVLVEDNKTKRSELLFNRNKNHRFISEFGYLCWASPSIFDKKNLLDDGENIDEEETWKMFLDPKSI